MAVTTQVRLLVWSVPEALGIQGGATFSRTAHLQGLAAASLAWVLGGMNLEVHVPLCTHQFWPLTGDHIV